MTLLVAGINEQVLWMVGDTFVTGGPLGAREYEHQLKILPSEDGKALIGFAGDHYHGVQAIETARLQSTGRSVAEYLFSVAREYPVEFAYGYQQDGVLRLLKVTNERVAEQNALYLGHSEAFDQFQAIRHRAQIDPVPKAIEMFLFGSASKDKPPRALSQSTSAMMRLFFERPERDVGGAAIPYMMGPDGIFLCEYSFAVSDPITDKLTRGDIVPHGTADRGGFALSVSSYNRHEGIVLYWLQKPGGFIFVRDGRGFRVVEIVGSPSAFCREARELNLDVQIFFSEKQNLGQPDSISVLHDQNGKAVITVAKYGRDLEFHAIDTSVDFRTTPSRVDFGGQDELSCSVARATVVEGGNSISIEFLKEEAEGLQVSYTAKQLDELIATLSNARSRLTEAVPVDHHEGRSKEPFVIDPMWRTERAPPPLQGIALRLRHLGVGWISFLLPHHEAASMGDWLSTNAQRTATE
jgi:hypothetical protein